MNRKWTVRERSFRTCTINSLFEKYTWNYGSGDAIHGCSCVHAADILHTRDLFDLPCIFIFNDNTQNIVPCVCQRCAHVRRISTILDQASCECLMFIFHTQISLVAFIHEQLWIIHKNTHEKKIIMQTTNGMNEILSQVNQSLTRPHSNARRNKSCLVAVLVISSKCHQYHTRTPCSTRIINISGGSATRIIIICDEKIECFCNYHEQYLHVQAWGE